MSGRWKIRRLLLHVRRWEEILVINIRFRWVIAVLASWSWTALAMAGTGAGEFSPSVLTDKFDATTPAAVEMVPPWVKKEKSDDEDDASETTAKKDHEKKESDDKQKPRHEDEGENKPKKRTSDAKDKDTDDKNKEESEKEDKKSDERSSKKKSTDDKPKPAEPQVEVYIPSVQGLATAFKKSKTSELCNAVSSLIVPDEINSTDEGFDWNAVLKLVQKIASWPDTSVTVTTYPQDRDGRPRWALKLDWPIDKFRGRLEELLHDEAAAKILKDIKLISDEKGTWRLELPDMLLAVITAQGDGTLVSSAADVQIREHVAAKDKDDDSSSHKKSPDSLISCRLNLAATEEESEDSLFSQISVVRDIEYSAFLLEDGMWRESFVLGWNPMLGMLIKAAIGKVDDAFDCPTDAYFVAGFHLNLAQGFADAVAGLPPMTIGSRASSDTAMAVVPGTGFFPFPDIYYQFHHRRRESTIKDIREFIAKDTAKRREDDRRPSWHEESVDGQILFWNNPSANGGGGFTPVTYRTVLFFDNAKETDQPERLIVVQTSAGPFEAVKHWKKLSNKTQRLPSSKRIHWQARIGWDHLYKLARPYITLLTGLSEESGFIPSADKLKDALEDSVIDMRITFGGIAARHTGPVPIGVVYVPLVTGTSLSAGAGSSSESSREQIAAQNLRVLYYHAKLFKKDFSRWPATVAELDGYVDFASHPELLQLQAKRKSFVEGVVSLVTGPKGKKAKDEADDEEDDREIDDSLYVIDWAKGEGWRLQFRPGEFQKYDTMYIDADGKIHRVEMKSAKSESKD